MQKTSQKPQVYLIRRYPLNDATPIEWDQTLSWMQELLEELCQEVESTDLELMKTQGLVPKINFSGTLSRNHNHELKDFFVVKENSVQSTPPTVVKMVMGLLLPSLVPSKQFISIMRF